MAFAFCFPRPPDDWAKFMSYGIPSAPSNPLQALSQRAGVKIAGAIQTASAQTGIDFSYLLQQANVESSFKTNAKAKSSSASGLFQFIESTWIGMVKKYGDKYGLDTLANKISDSGKVNSASVRKQILDLRKDPKISSLMAGEFAADNREYLEKTVGGKIGSTELYMAHFMGAGGASQFLGALSRDPNAKGVALFPEEARANKGVFYTPAGKPRSLAEIYAHFDSKFQIQDGESVVPAEGSPELAAIDCAVKSDSSLSCSQDLAATRAKNIYSEQAKKWVRSPAPHSGSEQMVLGAYRKNSGGLSSLQSLIINPIDVLALIQDEAHNDESRYNA